LYSSFSLTIVKTNSYLERMFYSFLSMDFLSIGLTIFMCIYLFYRIIDY